MLGGHGSSAFEKVLQPVEQLRPVELCGKEASVRGRMFEIDFDPNGPLDWEYADEGGIEREITEVTEVGTSRSPPTVLDT